MTGFGAQETGVFFINDVVADTEVVVADYGIGTTDFWFQAN